jgi:hypothetical protein
MGLVPVATAFFEWALMAAWCLYVVHEFRKASQEHR